MRGNGSWTWERAKATSFTKMGTSISVNSAEARQKGRANTSGATEKHMKESGIKAANMAMGCGEGFMVTHIVVNGRTASHMVSACKYLQMAISTRGSGDFRWNTGKEQSSTIMGIYTSETIGTGCLTVSENTYSLIKEYSRVTLLMDLNKEKVFGSKMLCKSTLLENKGKSWNMNIKVIIRIVRKTAMGFSSGPQIVFTRVISKRIFATDLV
jgi:hypothetical protein